MAHSHGGGGHSHGGGSQNSRALAIALAITATYTVAEVIGGLITGSLALLADAGHMLSDNFSLGLALFAFWLSAKPPTPERSFGFKRAEILAALFNGVTLVAISIWIFYEAYRRFQDPPEILGGWMMAVAVMGLFVNVAAALVLSRSEGESLNLQGALRHILADLAGSVGVIAAAVVILLTGWLYVDPLISVLIGLLVLGSSWKLLRDSTNILLESAPSGIDPGKVGEKRSPCAAWRRYTTCTSGRSRAASRLLLPTSSSDAKRIATRGGGNWRSSSTGSLAWSTPRCRSTTSATTTQRDRACSSSPR